MKIAVLTLSFLPEHGGVQRYLYEICQRLAKNNHVIVLTTVDGDLPPDAKFDRVVVSEGKAKYFQRVLQRIRPNRVLIGHAHPQLFLAARRARFSYATMTHGNDFLAAQLRWHRPIFNHLLKQSKPVITNTVSTKEKLAKLGMRKVEVVYPGVDTDIFTPAIDTHHSTPAILTVGRLVPRKGIDKVLRAMPQIRSAVRDFRYYIVGDGPDKPRLERLAHDIGVTGNVRFFGDTSFEELLDLYRRSDVFIMPAREVKEAGSVEGFGIVYLEASACCLPVVAGRSGGAIEAVREGETGILIDPNSVNEIAQTVIELLRNPQKRIQLGLNGRNWVQTEMSWERAADQMAKLLINGA